MSLRQISHSSLLSRKAAMPADVRSPQYSLKEDADALAEQLWYLVREHKASFPEVCSWLVVLPADAAYVVRCVFTQSMKVTFAAKNRKSPQCRKKRKSPQCRRSERAKTPTVSARILRADCFQLTFRSGFGTNGCSN